ncbi:PatB family C-S lyase [Bifidobacterium sp. ESL0798]|uniref:MalY/PatB family protein n=1 Tax=Bifidobacterium sp. ESL0798 TaxID=2983235 RepID=UPI0023F6F773|nr:PatB family C-S lyase [Bifidobacterium sp. ESL0798]WEV74535.1 PatB family C-S lyase [Bifidobacterium sp. ESL0798]
MNSLDTVIDRKNTYSIKWDGIGLDYKNLDLTPMSIADMDFKVPQEVIDAVVAQAKVGIYGYAMPAESYTSVFTGWLKERNDWQLQEDNIGFVIRVVDAISMAIRSMSNEGDAVIVFTPLYGFFESAVVGARRKLVANRINYTDHGYEVDFDEFERQIESEHVRMFILCNPHNPTGRVWTREELTRMVEICKAHDVIIISDDIHSDLIMPGYHYTPIAKIAKEMDFDKVITMKSASKTFNVAGLQLGYYISENPDIMKHMQDEKDYTTYPDLPNNFVIAAITAAYKHGVPWLENVLQYIEGNYQMQKKLIEEKFPKAHLAELQGTYLTWLDVSYLGIDEKTLMDRLDKCGVGAETTSSFGIKDGLYIRMNIACPKATMQTGLDALEKALSM